jgi:3',5'-cyclic AMP phosphodiesterase CpdA
MSAFVLAHLSDPHLAPLPRPRVRELASKRIGGFINWQRNRRHVHLSDVLERIVADVKAQAPDHIAVTGDLLNLSLAAEYSPALIWLGRLGSAHDVTLIPGNHDIYVRAMAEHPQRHWADYMRGDAAGSEAFPFLRRRGPVALIGLSTAVPAPPFRATGRLGPAQLARLAALLDRLAGEAVFRIVLLHHPPLIGRARRHDRLLDEDAFLDVLRAHGAELVLHGHEHVHSLRWFDGPQRPIAAVGVPSASAAGGKYDPAGYNLYTIEGEPGAWHCQAVSRGLAASGERVVELKRSVLC